MTTTAALNMSVKQLPTFSGELADDLQHFAHMLKGWVECNVDRIDTHHLLNLLSTVVFPYRSEALKWFTSRKAHFTSMTVHAATTALLQELQAEFSHLVPDPTAELVAMRLMPKEQVSAFIMRFTELHERTSMGQGEAMRTLIKAVEKNQQVHNQLTSTFLSKGEECTLATLCKVAERVARMGLSSSVGKPTEQHKAAADTTAHTAHSALRQTRQGHAQHDPCPRHPTATHSAHECRVLQAERQHSYSFAAAQASTAEAQGLAEQVRALKAQVQQLQRHPAQQPPPFTGHSSYQYAVAPAPRLPPQDARMPHVGQASQPRFPPHRPCGTHHPHTQPCPRPRPIGHQTRPPQGHHTVPALLPSSEQRHASLAAAYVFPSGATIEYPPKQCSSFALQHCTALPRSFAMRTPNDRVLRSARTAGGQQLSDTLAPAEPEARNQSAVPNTESPPTQAPSAGMAPPSSEATITVPLAALTQGQLRELTANPSATISVTVPAATAVGLLSRTDILPVPDANPVALAAAQPQPRKRGLYRVPATHLTVVYNGESRSASVALLDTGSEPNIMSTRFADENGILYFNPPQPVMVKQALGGEGCVPMEVRGEVTCVLNEGTAQESSTYTPDARKFLVMDMGEAPMYDLLLGVDVIDDWGAVPDSTTESMSYRPHKRYGDVSTMVSVPLICTGPLLASTHTAAVHCVVCMAACSVRASDTTTTAQAPRPTAATAPASHAFGFPATQAPRQESAPPPRQQQRENTSSGERSRTVWGKWCALFTFLLCCTGLTHISRFMPPPYVPTARISAMMQVQERPVLSILPGGHESIAMGAGYVKDPDLGVVFGNHPDLSPELNARLRAEIWSRKSAAFAYEVSDLGSYNGTVGPFTIQLTTDEPVQSRQRPKSKIEREIVDEKCGELLKCGIIQATPVGAQYASETVQPSKKDAEGNYTERRFCIDLRKLNAVTVRDAYGMHIPEVLFRDMQGASFFTKIDLRAGYHQIPIAPKDMEKTTFFWGNRLFMFTRMPFGARNATAHFQRIMDAEILKNGLLGIACSFVDDILVYSRTAEEHVHHVARTLDMLVSCNLKAHPDKTIVGAASVEFLGFNISAYGIRPEDAKVQAIRDMRAPTNVAEVRSIMGFYNYYRCFVPNFSAIARPIYALTKETVKWQWGPAEQDAFNALKQELCTPGKAIKHIDPENPLILHTDWSKNGIGAVLGQKDEVGNEYMVACISRSLSAGEKNYVAFQGEMLAAVWAIKSLHVYLHGVPFTLVTDHQPLTWLMQKQDLTGMHARWVLALQPYEFTIVHRPGIKHQNADCLSRLPAESTTDITGARLDADTVHPTSHAVSFMLAHNTSAHVAFQLAFIDSLPYRSAADSLHLQPITEPCAHDGLLPMPIQNQNTADFSLAARAGGYAHNPVCAFTTRSAQLPITQLQDTAAELQDMADAYNGWANEVHDDAAVLRYVITGDIAADTPAAERKRIQRRARNYSVKDGALMRMMPDGEGKVVPPVADRKGLIAHVHAECGHYGGKRTLSLLLPYYWWYGMRHDVMAYVRECQVCDLANTALNASAKVLSPLPIKGMFYRWGVDLAGPFNPPSTQDNKYVMLMVEHFSKVVVAVAIPDKLATTTARVFLEHVLCKFGCCAEVITDRGTEFSAEFEGLLRSQFIDHRVTSPNHPQADGLAERAVQTIKRALRKYAVTTAQPETWDACLPWIVLGYNCSAQASTKMSPYFLMFARHPLIPSNHARSFEVPLELTDSDAAAASALARAELAHKAGIMAMGNLQIAQQRDTLRYATIRDGGYLPSLREFSPGDYVYVRSGTQDSVLQFKVKAHILRVKSVKDNGTIQLQGKCTHTMITNVVNCAPCHLPDIDGTMDSTLARPHAYLACEVCRFMDQEDIMVLCDACNSGYHTICLIPPLASVPTDTIWLCPTCVSHHVTEQDVLRTRAAINRSGEVPEDGPILNGAHVPLFRDATARRKRQEAASLDGAIIRDPYVARSKAQRQQQQLGRVTYLGEGMGLKCLRVNFADGTQALMSATEVRHRQMPSGTAF